MSPGFTPGEQTEMRPQRSRREQTIDPLGRSQRVSRRGCRVKRPAEAVRIPDRQPVVPGPLIGWDIELARAVAIGCDDPHIISGLGKSRAQIERAEWRPALLVGRQKRVTTDDKPHRRLVSLSEPRATADDAV